MRDSHLHTTGLITITEERVVVELAIDVNTGPAVLDELDIYIINRYPHINEVLTNLGKTCNVVAKKSNYVRTINAIPTNSVSTLINVNGEPRPYAFYRDVSGTRETWIMVAADSVRIGSGLEDLEFKTTGSSFTNFHLCENTALQDTDDHIFSATVKAHYNIDTSIGVENIPFDRIFKGIRKSTLDVFAQDGSAPALVDLEALL
ncbi:hypothetical protein K493DRAFT_354053 [Basidiobolus meristosporus CBS 931.73]|uniref:factor independent urate hydroxylase n=1 Tax=Basidiobolus meristosporus CBS 931.73 TaxID=1314790 RepID=A0A1Y1Y4C8_9FUNG|nr:hypothetical protein K493DRAFT_354053 [Basidiobolus meristosporus CBS 931.73]|eukprot:ORX92819.1 hypothetical protein K493DRAFT_354053 [Basidiobolus meristosporus CBS 931.73]